MGAACGWHSHTSEPPAMMQGPATHRGSNNPVSRKGASILLLATFAAVVVVLVINGGEDTAPAFVAESTSTSVEETDALIEVQAAAAVAEQGEKMHLKDIMNKLRKAKKQEKAARSAKKAKKMAKLKAKALHKIHKGVRKAAVKRLLARVQKAVMQARDRADREARQG